MISQTMYDMYPTSQEDGCSILIAMTIVWTFCVIYIVIFVEPTLPVEALR
jgi:hypothetical protein